MELIKSIKNRFLSVVFFMLLLKIPFLSIAQRSLFIDKNVSSIVRQYIKCAPNDTVLHLTIDENIDGIDYTIVGADTQEAAAKRKIQSIFRERHVYVLLISNLKKGIQLESHNQPLYRKWINAYLKPQTIETDYPDDTDTTHFITEIKTRLYHPLKMIIRYRKGKFYDKNIYSD